MDRSKKELSQDSRLEDDQIFEFANLGPSSTGLAYTIHIRSTVETESPEKEPTLTVYEGLPSSSESFSFAISDSPTVPESQIESGFLGRITAEELTDIKNWIAINRDELLNFYFKGINWFTSDIHRWEKTKIKKLIGAKNISSGSEPQ